MDDDSAKNVGEPSECKKIGTCWKNYLNNMEHDAPKGWSNVMKHINKIKREYEYPEKDLDIMDHGAYHVLQVILIE